MERNYKAFISYRHLPIDADIAEKVHKTIETFIIPKEYRKDGNKKLGLVFRDKDELPITSNLSENLRMALDHSEYLISICSPKTKESIWVLEEIEYFIKTHDRDHVLVFLVDGTMEESVPHQLTKVYDESGEFIQHVEPLAANIVAETKKKRDQLFKVEVLRILATLIQCPFDALYRREMRRKVKRVGFISGIAFAVVLAFVGMLWNRNQEINKRLQETLIKESEITAIMSEEAEKDGEYELGIEYALDGLPENEDNSDRPYVPESELALSNRLNPYSSECFEMTGSLVQDIPIEQTSLSPDGQYLATRDDNYSVRVYRCDNNELVYTFNEDETYVVTGMFFTRESKLILLAYDSVLSYDLSTGNKEYEIENLTSTEKVADKDLVFGIRDKKAALYSAKDGLKISECEIDGLEDYNNIAHVVMTEDESYLAFSHAKCIGDQEYWIEGWDLKNNKAYLIQHFTEDGYYHNLCFTEKNMLVTGHMILSEFKTDFFCFDMAKDKYEEKEKFSFDIKETSAYREDGSMYLNAMEFLKIKEDVIYLVNRKTLSFINLDTKEKIRNERLTGFYNNAKLLDDGSIVVVSEDGRIIRAFSDENQPLYKYTLDFEIRNVSISGDAPDQVKIVARSMDNLKQCTYVCWKGMNADSTCLLTASEKADRSNFVVSRDGSRFGIYTTEYDQENREEILHLSLYDQEKKEKEFSVVVPSWGLNNYSYLTKNFLVTDGFLINLEKEEVIELDDSIFYYESSAGERLLFQAYVEYNEKDMIFIKYSHDTDQQEEISLKEKLDELYPGRSCGGSNEGYDSHWVSAYISYVIDNNNALLKLTYYDDSTGHYSPSYFLYDIEKDNLVELTDLDGESIGISSQLHNRMAFSNDGENIAYLNQSKKIEIRNMNSMEIVRTIDGLNADTVGKLFFDVNDKHLFVMTDSGEFLVYNISDGELIYQKSFGQYNNTFSGIDDYRVYYSDAQNKMIIVWKASLLTRSAGYIFDMDSLSLVGTHYDIVHYFKDTDRVLVNTYQGGLYTYPLYSRKDLVEMAMEILK